jgi:integrating conjugative element protein (TIGR03756 family)
MKIRQIILICLLVSSVNTVNAKTFNVSNLTSSAASTDCLDYCVDGACFWLVCSFFGCSVKVTPHINHNLPDFVVTSYNEPGENSFLEVQLLDQTSGIQGGNLSTKSNTNSNIKFKETSVIGNPVAYAMGRSKYLCKSKINAYMPYYLSTLDKTMWRSGLSDALYPSSWVLGMNEIGSWGSLYPRSGFLNQSHEVKAASVIAARGLEVVNEGGLRIYQSPKGGTSTDVMKKSGKWQMVSPIKENSCRAFGTESIVSLKNKIDDDGQYGWTAWRNYGCCIPGRGFFIGSSITGCIN